MKTITIQDLRPSDVISGCAFVQPGTDRAHRILAIMAYTGNEYVELRIGEGKNKPIVEHLTTEILLKEIDDV